MNLFYEKQVKKELEDQKMLAIISAQAFSYATPASNRSEANRKNQAWKRFINSFEWDKIINNPTQTADGLLKMFGALGVPVKRKKDDDKKK